MRIRMPVLAAGTVAAALAFASGPATSAVPLPKLNDFSVFDADMATVTLFADAPPALDGAEATILFDAQPFQGPAVAGAGLAVGPNLIVAPNMGPGWFTAVGAFKAKATNFDELPLEQ